MKKSYFISVFLMGCLLLAVIVVAGEGDPVVENKQITGSLLFDAGATVDEFSTDGTLGGDSDTAVPTEKAVKTYVDDQIGGITFSQAAVLGTL